VNGSQPYNVTLGSVGDAVRVEDPVHPADGAQDGAEVFRIAHLEREAALGDAIAARHHRGGEDVQVLVGQDPGDVAEQPGPVQRLDLDLHEEQALRVRRPVDLHHPVGLAGQVRDVVTVAAVYRDPRTPGDEPDDRVPRHRSAAPRQLHPQVVTGVLDHHAGRASAGDVPATQLLGDDRVVEALVVDLFGVRTGAERVDQLAQNGLDGDVALAERRV